ncbi:MAG TPA: NAD(P)-dependent oxidoreductase [Pelomicrobium sp.]|nr:NAD(P)-dependent oxidoreductase [Pelomicrobium sp.]
MPELPVVLLTNPIDPAGKLILEPHARVVTAPDAKPDTLRELVRDADGLIVRVKLPDDIVEHAPKLKGIVRHGTGLDFIPVAAATARRIPVANVPGANSNAVAEFCFGAVFELIRHIGAADRLHRDKGWAAARKLADTAWELKGKTLGIVGFGSIGRLVAGIGANGFGMKVIATTRRPETLADGVKAAALGELFEQSDVIVLSCPLTDATRGLVGRDLLERAKPTALLVNISRRAVVSDEALAEALSTGRLGGAVIEVFAEQQLPADDPLFLLPNLLLTPHMAALTQESVRNMSVGAAEEMLRILKGERPVNFCNPEILS